MRLHNKCALVTGAGSGIGRAIALAFAREGAQVALVGRDRARLEAVAAEVGRAAFVCPADMSRLAEITRAADQVMSRFGALHVLVNNAGVMFPGTAESQTEEEWDTMFRTNVKGVWWLSRAVLPHMRKAGGGSIINISSGLGLVGGKNRAGYAATKGAVTLMTKAMALDHAHEQIRVNCVCPAVVETALTAGVINNAPDPAAMRRARIALHPLGRLGRPEDIAPIVVYLASDESAWVTGAAFPVDGGYTAG
jgi:NAD(P)-dependent dehydrogenase (short-subunit alcohol dehydrogenase family)